MVDPVREVRGIEFPEPISIDASATLRAVASVLESCGVGVIVVAGTDSDVGVISERDIVAAIAADADVDAVRAGDIATRRLVTATPHDGVAVVARRALEAGVRHVLVVDDDAVVGVLSMRDLLAVFVES